MTRDEIRGFKACARSLERHTAASLGHDKRVAAVSAFLARYGYKPTRASVKKKRVALGSARYR